MTPDQALNIIRETTAQLSATLSTHQTILQAINTLQDLVYDQDKSMERDE